MKMIKTTQDIQNLLEQDFTEKEIYAIADAIVYGAWGSDNMKFHGNSKYSWGYGYITTKYKVDEQARQHLTARQYAGLYTSIFRKIKQRRLPYIEYVRDWWREGQKGSDFIFVNTDIIPNDLMNKWADEFLIYNGNKIAAFDKNKKVYYAIMKNSEYPNGALLTKKEIKKASKNTGYWVEKVHVDKRDVFRNCRNFRFADGQIVSAIALEIGTRFRMLGERTGICRVVDFDNKDKCVIAKTIEHGTFVRFKYNELVVLTGNANREEDRPC